VSCQELAHTDELVGGEGKRRCHAQELLVGGRAAGERRAGTPCLRPRRSGGKCTSSRVTQDNSRRSFPITSVWSSQMAKLPPDGAPQAAEWRDIENLRQRTEVR
jgi:hypothetical protein